MNLTYFSPKTEKRASTIEGTGLFAKQPIAAGEIVVVKGGYVMPIQDRDAIGEKLGPSDIQIEDDLFIGPATETEREGAMMHLNHSCDPNIGVRGQITFVAMCDIDAGRELNFDYAMTDNEPDLAMECHCGAPGCRKTITGRDWMRPELQQRYHGYFSLYLARRIAALT